MWAQWVLFFVFAVAYCFDKEVPRGWLRAMFLAPFALWLNSLASNSGPGMAWMMMCCILVIFCLVSFANPGWSKPFRIVRGVTLIAIVSAYLVAKTGLIQPFMFGSSCTICSAQLKNLAVELDLKMEESGEYPQSLERLSSPSLCPPDEVDSVARTLYGWQGITFERYGYEVTPEGYTLSCPTCHQRWNRKPGFPRYDSVRGLEETGMESPAHGG